MEQARVAASLRLEEEERCRAIGRRKPSASPLDVVFVIDNSGSMACGVAESGFPPGLALATCMGYPGLFPFRAPGMLLGHLGSPTGGSRSDKARECVLELFRTYIRVEVRMCTEKCVPGCSSSAHSSLLAPGPALILTFLLTGPCFALHIH
jgi:hypothetical protein